MCPLRSPALANGQNFSTTLRTWSLVLLFRLLSTPCRRAVFGWCHAKCRAERARKMTVAREAQIQCQQSNVFGMWKLRECSRETQPSLITIDRHAFDAMEQVSEIRWRRADCCRNLAE